MRFNLLPPGVNTYKANLHCHTTLSDGSLTPLEIKTLYQTNGYSIVAFTDHELLMDHSALNDASFLALTGYEIAVNSQRPARSFADRKTTHLNLLASRPDNLTHICYDPAAVRADPTGIKNTVSHVGPLVPREDSPAFLNRIIQEANENGFLVTYNHPAWSLAESADYLPLEGLFGIEIFNTGCVRIGIPDTTLPYDELLRQNKRLNCLATDDNHNRHPYGHPGHDSLGGWVVIHAETLEYSTIFNALKRGDFYSSSGPAIHSLYVEDNVLHIACSPVRAITVNSAGRAAGVQLAPAGESLTSAGIPLRDEFYDYIRITIEDASGAKAYSNAVFRNKIEMT